MRTARPLARYWMHNGMIRMGKSKMAKSRGNILTIRELRGKVPGEVLRLALLSARYRDPLEWSDELVAASRQRLDRLYRVLLDCAEESATESPPGREGVPPSTQAGRLRPREDLRMQRSRRRNSFRRSRTTSIRRRR